MAYQNYVNHCVNACIILICVDFELYSYETHAFRVQSVVSAHTNGLVTIAMSTAAASLQLKKAAP
jgi:hypothetical protein